MNDNCYKVCKHKSYCNLDSAKTNNCHNSDSELDELFGKTSGHIFGYTEDEIAIKQSIKKLNK